MLTPLQRFVEFMELRKSAAAPLAGGEKSERDAIIEEFLAEARKSLAEEKDIICDFVLECDRAITEELAAFRHATIDEVFDAVFRGKGEL